MQRSVSAPSKSKRKLLIFALLAAGLCIALYAAIMINGYGINSGSVFSLGLMWVPGFSALVSKLVVDHSIRGLGWKIHRQSLPCLGIAYLVPLVLCVVVYGLAWLTGLGRLQAMPLPQAFTFATAGVLISCLAALGEEIGWRGFLLTELSQLLPQKQVSLVIGIVWFLYHAPVIVFSNYNNGNIPCSLLCFFVMVMGFTFLVNALCLKAHSLWPAVLLHASHNVFVQSIFDAATVNGPYTQYLTSEFGIGLAAAYMAACVLYFHMEKKTL